jgi:16S rRNA C1402 N4-methylase RsmH
LTIDTPKVVVDATLGLGGHSMMMLSHMSDRSKLIGFDRDEDNIRDALQYIEEAGLS